MVAERRRPVKTYVLIQTQRDGDRLAERLRSIPEILSAEDIGGAYDAIALAQSNSEDLSERILAAIRKLPGVTRALPAPLVDPRLENTALPDER